MPEIVDKQTQRTDGKKYMLARYGRMKNIGLFEHQEAQIPKSPSKVVVKTDKGLELGEVVGYLTCYKGGRFKLSSEQIDEYFRVSEIDFKCNVAGKFVRYASADDLGDAGHFQKLCREEIATCRRFAQELGLNMKVVEAEHILGGERIIFYFMAEGRVDFRQLVKMLSHELQTRIEMRQIGARDEAKLISDVESCGQECCCRRFLRYLKPVNMRMAKMQKATLDPSKISGYCGRLKCCLRYEDQTYGELKRLLPRKNMMVRTQKGEGRVLEGQILTQLVLVEYENGDRETVPVEDLDVLGPGGPRPKNEPQERNHTSERSRRGTGRSSGGRSNGAASPNPDESSPDNPRPTGQASDNPDSMQLDEQVIDPSAGDPNENSSKKPKTRRRRRSGKRSGRRGGGRNDGNQDNRRDNHQPTAPSNSSGDA